MRLSEAIRLGAMNKPQGFGFYSRHSETCALGAALDATGHLVIDTRGNDLFDGDFPVEWQLHLTAAVCPVLGCEPCAIAFYEEQLGAVIAHLNDDHRWTRERIADWVESVEQAKAQPVIAQPEAVPA